MWEMNTLERRYSVPPSTISDPLGRGQPVEDLHAWSIYRQNINSGFTDSALGSSEKSSPPYGNFKLRESTVHSILSHPKYGPSRRTTAGGAEVGHTNGSMYAYLKFGLPRVFPPSLRMGGGMRTEGSSGYDSSDDGGGKIVHRHGHHRRHQQQQQQVSSSGAFMHRANRFRRSRSDPDFRNPTSRGLLTSQPAIQAQSDHAVKQKPPQLDTTGSEVSGHSYWRERRQKSTSEANLLSTSFQASEDQSRHYYPAYSTNSKFGGRHREVAGTGTDELDTLSRLQHHGFSSDIAYNNGYQQRQQQHHNSRHISSPLGRHQGPGSQMSGISHTTRSSRTHIGAFNALAQAGGGMYSREAQLLNDKFFPRDTFITTFLGDVEGGVFKHPHLQVRNLSYEVRDKAGFFRKSTLPYGQERFRLLDSITLEVHGGEILAVMATCEEEGTILLDVLANRHHGTQSRIRGDLVVNGVPAQPDKLHNRVTYVQQDCSYMPDMSVRQTLLFTSLLKEPGNPSRGFDTKGRINALIEDLGLGLVKHTRVKHLTPSEKRRLNVACHLLLDTDIVLLDQPTKGMDIFDTFFLVEYLRQWAARGRIVILTIHPPTYEIFTMMSKIALLSAGRLMYFGKRREMLPYFAFIEFPCPAYKNPSDYYLDLVTLDNLSSEAMLESSERINLLGDTFLHRQEPLLDPGPPGIPPPKVKPSNMLVQILALWIRAMIYMFPFNFCKICTNVFIVALISTLIGAIYENVRLDTEQDAAQDRVGFYYVVMAVAVWPILLLTVTEVWCNKDAVNRDLEDQLYSKAAYIISKMTYSLLTSFCVSVAYIVPAYVMSGLKRSEDAVGNLTLSVYLGYMILYLAVLRCLAIAAAFTFDSYHAAAAFVGVLLTAVAMVSGYPVHLQDLSVLLFWLKWVSPTRWILEQAVTWDVGVVPNEQLVSDDPADKGEVFTCSTLQPVVAPGAAIILKPPCNLANGAELLQYFGLGSSKPLYVPILATVAFGLFWLLWSIVVFNVRRQQRHRKTHQKLRRPYQP